MEVESRELKRKYVSCRASLRSCRERLKYQASRSRALIAAVTARLEEANKEVKMVQQERQCQLEWVSRELLLLQSNMVREQKRLTTLMSEKLQIPPPPPPRRSKLSEKDERIDSGRESDETFESDNSVVVADNNDNSVVVDNSDNSVVVTNQTVKEPPGLSIKTIDSLKPDFLAASSPRSSGRSLLSITEMQENLEQFIISTSNEISDIHHNNPKVFETFQKTIVSPIHQMTNHKMGLKPSDIKYRAKLKTVMSGVTALEEQVDDKTTVTYWTEPFL